MFPSQSMGHGHMDLNVNWFLTIFLLAYPSICSSQDYYLDEDYHEHLLKRQDQLEQLDYENITFTKEDLDDLFQILSSIAEIREGKSDEAAEKALKESLDSMLLAESQSNSDRKLGGSTSRKGASSFGTNMKDWLLWMQLKLYIQQKFSATQIFGSGGGSGGQFLNDFGKPCDPMSANPCKFPGYVSCMDVKNVDRYGNPVHSCVCDFLHTQVDPPPGKTPCVKNVNTRCTDGAMKYECGENMECLPDALGLDEESYCYCKEGFAPAKNPLGILGLCRPIIQDDLTDEDGEDYSEPNSGLTVTVQQGLLLLCAIGLAM